jgi:hypothetical protein
MNGKFNAAMSKDNQDHSALIETLEKEVISFWREAGDRFAAIELPRNSPHESKLEILQDVSDGRADAYQLWFISMHPVTRALVNGVTT